MSGGSNGDGRKDEQRAQYKNIANGWKNFWCHEDISKSKINFLPKIKILEQCVVPSLTYGAYTWELRSLRAEKIETTHNRMLRSILNLYIKDKK